MAIASVAELIDALKEIPLLEASQLEEISSDQRFGEPELLAAELRQRGWLTAYQVALLIEGRARDLILGPYLVLEHLGEGGMGQVLKARHQRMKRLVAIKIIRTERLAHVDAERRFYREIEAAARLMHPNIVMAYDADQVNSTHYFAMEYVEGTDLAKLVRQRGPLPVSEACDYVRQAGLGLQHAHEQGLVHRDIKPANLLVTAQGAVVKILDMGLARLKEVDASAEPSHELTHTGVVMGTPDYLAPEQAMNPREADIRADIYSLGCTLYFLLSGQPPFPGGTLMEKLVRHRENEPTPIEELRPDLPRGLGLLVRKLMAKRPDDRPQIPVSVVSALEPFCDKTADQHTVASTMLLEGGRIEIPPEAIEPYAIDEPTQSIHDPTKIEDWTPATPTPVVRSAPVALATTKAGGRSRSFLVVLAALAALAAFVGWQTSGVAAAIFLPVLVLTGAAISKGSRRSLTVQAPWPDADVHVDKKRVALDSRSIGRVELTGGEHTLVIRRHDTELLRRTIRVREESEEVVRLVEVQVPVGEIRRFVGHTASVLSVAVSPDGRLAASGSKDTTIRIWDLTKGRELRSLEGHTFDVSSVAFSPDGRCLLSASGRFFQGTDKTLRLWDVSTGKELLRLEGHEAAVLSVAISPSGRTALSGGVDRSVRLWDLVTGKELCRFKGHEGPVTSVAFTPEGRCAISGGVDQVIRIWDVQTQSYLDTFKGHTSAVLCVAISPDGRYALSGSLDKTARLWSVQSGEEVRQFTKHAGAVMCVGFSRDSQRVLTASGMQFRDHQWVPARDYSLRLWSAENGRELLRFEQSQAFRCATISPDGRHAISGGYDADVRLWGIAR